METREPEPRYIQKATQGPEGRQTGQGRHRLRARTDNQVHRARARARTGETLSIRTNRHG